MSSIDEEKKGIGLSELTEFERVGGQDFAGDPYASVKHVADVMSRTFIEPHMLKDFDSFEDTLVAILTMRYHVMCNKQRDYGPHNISKAGIRGILTRWQDKLERAKQLVGDPEKQVEEAKKLLVELDAAETAQEVFAVADKLTAVLNPESKVVNESVEDTFMDGGNYTDIGLHLLYKAWDKPFRMGT